MPFESVNILEDEMLRSGMKEFSQWPTFPQVYINGEFYGGCDIMIGEPLSQHCHRITHSCFGRPPFPVDKRLFPGTIDNTMWYITEWQTNT